jgi:hypothetical protein
MCTEKIYIHEYIHNAISLVNPFLLPSLICFTPLYTSQPTFFTYLEIPLLVIVVRISIHSRPWLVVNCYYPTASLHQCHTASLPHCRMTPLPHCPTASLPHCPTASLPHCLTRPLPHHPTASLPHCLTASLPHYPIPRT